MAGETDLPAADGQAVYDYIIKTNPFQKWPLYPRRGELYAADSHSSFLTTYVSPNTLEAIQSKGPFPDNSFIVTQMYKGGRNNVNKTLNGVLVMYRVSGYNPEAGNWFWAKYGQGGKIQLEGKVALCIDCHVKAKEKDWVFGR